MIFVSSAADYVLWLVVIAVLYVWKGKRAAFSYTLVLFVAWLLALALKSYFMVPRPDDVRFVIEAHGYSMPSGHTSRAFASAMFLHPRLGKLKYPVWALAVLIGVSRICLGVHYPSDVIAGALLGCAVGYFGLRLERSIKNM